MSKKKINGNVKAKHTLKETKLKGYNPKLTKRKEAKGKYLP